MEDIRRNGSGYANPTAYTAVKKADRKPMNAKEYLRQVAKLNNMLRNKTAELEMWRSVAVGISGSCDGERVQSSGNPQKMADAVIKCVETEQQISDYIHRKSQIIKDIERLPAEEYDLLHKKYIQFFTLDEIAAGSGKSYSWATSVHGIALKHLQEILDERGRKGNV